jgi:hypothetical protein
MLARGKGHDRPSRDVEAENLARDLRRAWRAGTEANSGGGKRGGSKAGKADDADHASDPIPVIMNSWLSAKRMSIAVTGLARCAEVIRASIMSR